MMTRARNEGPAVAGGGRTGKGAAAPAQFQHSTGCVGCQVYAQGRVVGRIAADGWLEKRGVDPARHKLRKPEGWATSAAHLDLPIQGVRLFTVDGDVLEAPIALWRRYGVRIERGHGAQVVLPIRYWTARRAGAPAARQLCLFGV